MGGVIFPLIILYLAPSIGFPWAIRAIGILSGVLLLIGCFLVRSRLPLNKHAGSLVDFGALKNVRYGMTTLAIFFIEFAVYIPLTYISSYAIHMGIDSQHAYRMVVFLNGASVIGRVVPGFFADRYGHFNIMASTSMVCSLFIFMLWNLSGKDEATLTAFAVMFGFWSGTAIGLSPVCIAQVCKIEDYGKRNGTTYAISSFGALIGIPIAGTILNQSGSNYFGLIMFGGALYAAGSISFAVTRGIARGWALKAIF
jgi:predicted MFS family arabinose efflux permease